MATKKPCQVVYSLPKSLSQDEQIGCLGRPMRPCRKKCPGPNSMNKLFVRVTKFFGHRVSRSGFYLGCEIHYGSEKMSDGHEVRTVTYDMTKFLSDCVSKYRECSGFEGDFPKVPTPNLVENTREHKARSPNFENEEMAYAFVPGARPRVLRTMNRWTPLAPCTFRM